MDPATIAILLGSIAASSAASVYTNQQNIKYAQEANEESVNLANTAHQREVRDLQAAGLNPILSARGSGADVPSLKTPGLENPLEQLGSSAGTLASAFNGLTKAEVQSAQAEASSAKAEAALMRREATIDQMRKSVEGMELAAEYTALTDGRDPLGRLEVNVDPDFRYSSEGWQNLVKQKQNEIRSGAWRSSLERQVLKDSLDTVGSVVGTATGLHGMINSAKSFNRTRDVFNSKGKLIRRERSY